MIDRRSRRRSGETPEDRAARDARDDDFERGLGRAAAIGVPALTAALALVVGGVAGTSAAMLIIAAGALLGAIVLIWASVRTLAGDAPLAVDFAAIAEPRPREEALLEEKRRLLRALKDIETERDLGKIDESDYMDLVSRYRDEAKRVLRRLDVQVEPLRAEAERVAGEYLSKRGMAQPVSSETTGREPVTSDAAVPPGSSREPGRIVCSACGASNEADAVFCKQCGAGVQERGRVRS